MNRKRWQDREGHPPAALLLLHMEREIDEGEAESVRLHVASCSNCRAICDRMERGMSQFAAFRDSVALPTSAPRSRELLERIADESAPRPAGRFSISIRKFFQSLSARPVLLLSSGVACALIIYLALFLTKPKQSVYASQILSEARNASESLIVQSRVLNQKIRLRRGQLVIERIAHHGRRVSSQVTDPQVDAQFQQALNLARINLNDPLSVNDFTDWRALQNKHADSVRETAQSLIITIRVDGSSITEGSLTLSRSGLRPIARSVEFRNEAPIEISEENFSISDSISPTPSEAVRATPSLNTAVPANPTAGAPEPSALQLETSELDLREAFHAIGADVPASFQIARADHLVLFHARRENAEQANAVREAVDRIPYVKETDKPISQVDEMQRPREVEGPYTTNPPLAGALERAVGNEQAANNFVELIKGRSSKIQAEADALDQLGKRYPAETVQNFPPDLRRRVGTLASSMFSSLQRDAADYLKAVTPTLDDVAQGLNVPAPAVGDDKLPGCLAWQRSASLAAPRLWQFREDLLLLFTPQKAEASSAPSAAQLISDTRKARSFLELHLMSTCQLF